MPAGVPICRLRASARRISDSGYGGWPTTMAGVTGTTESGRHTEALMTGEELPSEKGKWLAGWPTTSANDDKPQSPLPEHLSAYLGDPSPRMRKAGWTTPQANEPSSKPRPSREGRTTEYLGRQAQMVKGWTTPRASDCIAPRKDTAKTFDLGWAQLRDQAAISGREANSFPAPTEKRGQLNPEFPRWLMGFPAAWGSCAPTATRSCRRLPPSSEPHSWSAACERSRGHRDHRNAAACRAGRLHADDDRPDEMRGAFSSSPTGARIRQAIRDEGLKLNGDDVGDQQPNLPTEDPLSVRLQREKIAAQAEMARGRRMKNDEAEGLLLPVDEVRARLGAAATLLRMVADGTRREVEPVCCDKCRDPVVAKMEATMNATIAAVLGALEGK